MGGAGKTMGIGLVCGFVVLSLLSMAVQGWLSHRPVKVGLVDGRLADCPKSPNCVSSDAPAGKHRVSPLAKPSQDGVTLADVKATIQALPRTRIVDSRDDYLHAEFESLIFRFVDDLEVHARPARDEIAVRSASRVGHWDMGTNRRRVERLRRRLEQHRAH